MNAVQMHIKVKSRLDQVQTPRFLPWQIDNAINTAIDYLLKSKVSGTIENGRRVSFQKVRTIRDELYTVVKEEVYNPSEDLPDIDFTFGSEKLISKAYLPSDYRYLVGLEIQINNNERDWTAPITYDELFVLKKDPYQRPSKLYPYNFYHIESNAGLEVIYGQTSADKLNYARMFYISQPEIVVFGQEISESMSEGDVVIALTKCVYNDVTYNPGDEITVLAALTDLTSGTAVTGYTNSDLPRSLHEEIVEDAAGILNMDIENYDKWKVMKEDEQLRKR